MPRAAASGTGCDCFISLDQVPGEAQDAAFAGAIEVRGWTWGASSKGSQVMAGGPKAMADVRHFTFEHLVDSATAGLWSRCVTNALIPNGLLTLRRAGGPSAQRYLEIRFKQVRIVDVSVAMSDENLIPLEKVTLAFESVTLDYLEEMGHNVNGHRNHLQSWKRIHRWLRQTLHPNPHHQPQ